MVDKFLKAKYWQLFILMFGIPIVFQFIIMMPLLVNINSENNTDPTTMSNYFKFSPLIMIIYMGIFFGWFWSIAMGLQNKVPENMKMKIKKNKIFFFIPLII